MLTERYPVPFLLENIADLLPDPGGELSAPEFLNVIAAETGCGILLDLYNLECNGHNHGVDVAAFLDELDFDHVHELHLACGIEHRGFWLDIHSRPTRESTIDLAANVGPRIPDLWAATYEVLPQAAPLLGAGVIVEQLERISHALESSPCPS
jgi:uncharacterized protein (UPF0276 family)